MTQGLTYILAPVEIMRQVDRVILQIDPPNGTQSEPRTLAGLRRARILRDKLDQPRRVDTHFLLDPRFKLSPGAGTLPGMLQTEGGSTYHVRSGTEIFLNILSVLAPVKTGLRLRGRAKSPRDLGLLIPAV